MKATEVFSKFLKSKDLEDGKGGYKTLILTIKDRGEKTAREHKFNDGTVQLVVAFEEDDRELGLNVTNTKAMVKLTGEDDTDNWAGHKIEVWVNPEVQYGSETVPGIRIRKPGAKKAATTTDDDAPPGDEAPLSSGGDEIEALAKAAKTKTDAWKVWSMVWKRDGNKDSQKDAWLKAIGEMGTPESQFTAKDWATLAGMAGLPF